MVHLRDSTTIGHILYTKNMNPYISPTFFIGTSDTGGAVYGDFEKSGGFISAGSTGSGHASFDEGAFVLSILQAYSPKEVRFAMVDPKQVQLTPYEDMIHLWTPIAYTPEQVERLTNALLDEVERRRQLFDTSSKDTWAAYAESAEEELPSIIILATEVADLMMLKETYYDEVLGSIAQQGKSVGVYLYLATQRPSADVLTQNIRNSIAGRLAFRVHSKVDSETLLGVAGAEVLSEPGELMVKELPDAPPMRVKAAHVTDEKIQTTVAGIQEYYAQD